MATVQLFPSAHVKQNRQIYTPVYTTHPQTYWKVPDHTFSSKNAVIKDASASPGQTSAAPCPVSVSYQPPDDTPSILWHSTAVSVLVRGHMTEDALERPTVEWCTFFVNVFAFLSNRCFPPESTVWGRHASEQPFSSPQASTTECSSSCLLSVSGYLLGLRCCHAHAHTGLWHF